MSLRGKTIIGIASIEAVLLISLIMTAVTFLSQAVNNDLVKHASTTATLFSTTTKDAVLSYDLASLDDFVLEALKNPGIAYARVISSTEGVLSQNGSKEALTRVFKADQHMEDVTDGIFDTYANIVEGNNIYGRVEIGISTDHAHSSISKIKQWTTSIAVIEMILVALFSYALGHYLTRQLKTLRVGAKKISHSVISGDFSNTHIPIKSKDELGEVTHAFNQMVETLKAECIRVKNYQEELENLNQTLEKRVAARTQLLESKNEQLSLINFELKSAQQQLVQAEKMASLGQLAAGVAHEINNPIGFVNSNLASLADYADVYIRLTKLVNDWNESDKDTERQSIEAQINDMLSDENIQFMQEDTLALIQESSDGLSRVKDIVSGLKQFSRADSQEHQIFNINDCVKTTLSMVSNELKYHCEIVTKLQDVPQVDINVGKICQVLTNLLINAGQAISQNGVISIETYSHDQFVYLSVCDTGNGIPADDIKRLFDPFFTTKPEGQGTGLGLAISYGIAQEHDGDLTVKSEVAQGSCFTLSLPAVQQEAEPVNTAANTI
ncbi:MAG: ATPase [Alteromonadaceae bacterium]|uniref:ATP-binding protein n=1 Tax=Paraglaciecola chathamensis TaxID=368405 RepID=UPI000C5879C2|nr:ATP-binding protein [Paraglaciecola agarilytica]MBN27351.1 ATPase [Alteromonadaceae bacterium]|tara:strand:+ start:47348 stop:49009 length:1662 start_codon:yes stop_codon:yes gene_type:complete